jgi:hypothetical protein
MHKTQPQSRRSRWLIEIIYQNSQTDNRSLAKSFTETYARILKAHRLTLTLNE